MSRITAVFHGLEQAQKALADLQQLGVSQQYILLSDPSEGAASLTHHPVMGMEGSPQQDLTLQSSNRDLFYIPPNNTMAPGGLAGTPMVVPDALLVDPDLAAEHMNSGNTAHPETDQEREFYQQELQEGHLLISVNAEDSLQEEQVRDVLLKHGGTFYLL